MIVVWCFCHHLTESAVIHDWYSTLICHLGTILLIILSISQAFFYITITSKLQSCSDLFHPHLEHLLIYSIIPWFSIDCSFSTHRGSHATSLRTSTIHLLVTSWLSILRSDAPLDGCSTRLVFCCWWGLWFCETSTRHRWSNRNRDESTMESRYVIKHSPLDCSTREQNMRTL